MSSENEKANKKERIQYNKKYDKKKLSSDEC